MGLTSFAVLFLVVASNFGLPTTASRSPILIGERASYKTLQCSAIIAVFHFPSL